MFTNVCLSGDLGMEMYFVSCSAKHKGLQPTLPHLLGIHYVPVCFKTL